MNLLLDQGLVLGYFMEPVKSLLICDPPTLVGVEKREFDAEGLVTNVMLGSQHLGTYVGQQ